MALTIDPRLIALNTAWQDDKPKRKHNLPKHYKVREAPDFTKLSVGRTLPFMDMSRHDPMCKKAWNEGFYLIHIQNDKLTPELHDALARFMTDQYGMRSVL